MKGIAELRNSFDLIGIPEYENSNILRFGIGISAIVPFFVYNIVKSIRKKNQCINNKGNKVIVITGCDTGIGLDLAHRMIKEEFIVIATVIDTDSIGSISLRSAGARVLLLNFPNNDHIKKISELVNELSKKGKKIHCLVNNAGVLTMGKCHWYTSTMIEDQIEVNLLGTIKMTEALIGQLHRNKGRIVNISSTMGLLSSPMLSVYCATKAAIESFSSSIRREGCKVIVVRPCNLPLQTNILIGVTDDLELMKSKKNLPPQADSEIVATIESISKLLEKLPAPSLYLTDDRLIKSLRKAILLESPLQSYTAGPWYIKILLKLNNILPESTMDLLFRLNIPFNLLNLSRQ